jgi:hypothetical protein
MNTALKRALGAGGALALAASVALVPATAAQADGQYYGAWTLTAWKVNGQTINCPGKLPLPPPAPTIECKGGEILELKSGYRYKTTIPAFKGNAGKGDFTVFTFPNRKYKQIVFDSDDAQDDPRAYKMKLQGTGNGAPKKMVVWLSVGRPGGEDIVVKMIFRRDAN